MKDKNKIETFDIVIKTLSEVDIELTEKLGVALALKFKQEEQHIRWQKTFVKEVLNLATQIGSHGTPETDIKWFKDVITIITSDF